MLKIIQFIKKNIWFLLGLLGIISVLGLKWFKSKPKDKTTTGNQLLTGFNLDEQQKIDYNKISRDLAHHLGTAYSPFNPKHWTENDEDVYNILKDLNSDDFEVISILYFEVYAKGRTLTTDLASLLDDEYYQLLNY